MITGNGLKSFMQAQVPKIIREYNSVAKYAGSYGLANDFPVELMK